MANFFKDNDDLRYYVEQGLDWSTLVPLVETDFKQKDGFTQTDEAVEFYAEILEMVGDFVSSEVAPHSAEIDREKMKLVDGEVVFPKRLRQIFEQIQALELHGMCVPRGLGGMNCPNLLYMLCCELIARGDISVMAHHGFHGGIALAMLYYDALDGCLEIDADTGAIVHTRFEPEIHEIMAGNAWGSMDITESDAGSDMGAIRARARQDADGQWRIDGEKIFITSGHGKHHFVVARSEEASTSGLEGLSLFHVSAYDEDASGQRTRCAKVDRLEEKIGHHGSATCTVSFESSPARLVGQRGDGFKLMLKLMNSARIGVGFEALGLCESAYRLSCDYAAERRSMGKTIDQHEMIADYLDEMYSDIQGIRALAINAAYYEELAQRYELKRRYLTEADSVDDQRLKRLVRRYQSRARRLTPLLKYMAAERAVTAGRRCIQIHGGVGYSSEFGAEKLLRDALVLPIYEGTSQIQGLMAMKDVLGGMLRNPQAFVKRVAQTRWRALSARDSLERRVARIQSVSLSVQQYLISRTAAAKLKSTSQKPITEWPKSFLKNWDPKRDFSLAMLHAERLIQILSDEAVCEILLEQAQAHEERREVLERYLERAEPRCRGLADTITSSTSSGTRLLKELEARAGTTDEAHGGT